MGLGEAVAVAAGTYSCRVAKKGYKTVHRAFQGPRLASPEVTDMLGRGTLTAHMTEVCYDVSKGVFAADSPSMRAIHDAGYEMMTCDVLQRESLNRGVQLQDDTMKLLRQSGSKCHVLVFWHHPKGQPIKVVVAVRGTNVTDGSDLVHDFKMAAECLHKTARVTRISTLIATLIKMYGARSVCLAGHSLGAAIGFCVGRQFCLDRNILLEGHFFALPFTPLDKVVGIFFKIFQIEAAVAKAIINSAGLGGLWASLKGEVASFTADVTEYDAAAAERQRKRLKHWHPFIYVQEYDRVSNGYIDFFRTSSHSMDGHVMSNATPFLHGLGWDPEAHHLCSSAFLITSDKGLGTLSSHGLQHWVDPDASRVKVVNYTNLKQSQVFA